MEDNDWIEVHDTAFATSAYRASNESVSKDIYAKLWFKERANQWVEGFLAKVSNTVSDEEPFAHCLRNRGFYETIKANKEIQVVINFGCGFSMYPFLLDDTIKHIEIDLPNVISLKKRFVDNWQKTGELPERDVSYISTDFSGDYSKDLLKKLKAQTQNKKNFIILEGVLFFLNLDETNRLFKFYKLLQNQGDFIGSVSYQDSIRDTSVFKRVIDFFGESTQDEKDFVCQTLPDSFYENLDGYNLVGHEDYYSLCKSYAPERKTKDEDNILNEHIYILQKK